MTRTTRALDGLRLVTLAPNLPGPLATARLRDMGMAVTKVEAPAGDPLEGYAPQWYADLCTGIDVVRLDLKGAADREALDGMLATADLLLTSHRPATLERFRLGWDVLHAAHPRLCHVAIVGERPPRDGIPGHDLTYQAMAGLVTPPQLPVALLADFGGALEAVIAALEVLAARGPTGTGGHRVVALAESARFFAQASRHGLTGRPDAMLGGNLALYNVYPAAEGWVAVAGLEGHFRQKLLAQFPGDGTEHDRLAAGMTARSAADWQAWAEAEGLPLVAVPSL